MKEVPPQTATEASEEEVKAPQAFGLAAFLMEEVFVSLFNIELSQLWLK